MQETQVWSLGWEDPLEEGSLQYSCLENPMSRGTWWATVHGMAKSQTDLATENACFLELHINGIIQFVLFCVWNAHGLICSTISLAQGWCQLPPHIPNSVEKVREDCAWVSKAKILEIEGLLWCYMLGTLSAPGTFFTWLMDCAVCRQRQAGVLFAGCQPTMEPNVKQVPRRQMPEWTCGTPTDPEAGGG